MIDARDNARFLWKRAPSPHKADQQPLALLWRVGKAMWQKDIPAVYRAIQGPQWGAELASLMAVLKEAVQKRQAYLVSVAYSSISVPDLSARLDLTAADVIKCKHVNPITRCLSFADALHCCCGLDLCRVCAASFDPCAQFAQRMTGLSIAAPT